MHQFQNNWAERVERVENVIVNALSRLASTICINELEKPNRFISIKALLCVAQWLDRRLICLLKPLFQPLSLKSHFNILFHSVFRYYRCIKIPLILCLCLSHFLFFFLFFLLFTNINLNFSISVSQSQRLSPNGSPLKWKNSQKKMQDKSETKKGARKPRRNERSKWSMTSAADGIASLAKIDHFW